jgi:hypothetical protein
MMILFAEPSRGLCAWLKGGEQVLLAWRTIWKDSIKLKLDAAQNLPQRNPASQSAFAVF